MPAEVPDTPDRNLSSDPEGRMRSSGDTQPIPTISLTPPPAPRKALRYWIGGIIAVLILAGAAASYWRDRPAPASGEQEGIPAEKDIPPTLRPYYDKALTGDASAMRMLGTMYYNGLNVPQNAKEGIRWYRKAAAAGSVAARKDLEQLGLTPAEP
jgi:TPR repeat protein